MPNGKVLAEDVYEVTEMPIPNDLYWKILESDEKEPLTACGNKLFRSEPNSLVAVAGRVFFEQENTK
jgi:hypothetical protein